MATLADKAAAMFGCDITKIPVYLFALNLRTTCVRCCGTGKHSYNQIDADRCYGCRGRGEVAAKLTKDIFAAASAKVAAGELAIIRARAAELRAAKAQIEPRVEHARAIYAEIGDEYTAASMAHLISPALHRAQHLNNELFWGNDQYGIHRLLRAMTYRGRRDFDVILAEIEECIAGLELLRAEWRRYKSALA